MIQLRGAKMRSSWLIGGFVSAILALFIIFYIVWINRAGENIIGVFGKTVLAPIVVAVGLLFFDLFTSVPNGRSTVPATFIMSNQNEPPFVALVDIRLAVRPYGSSAYGTGQACDILTYWSGKLLCMNDRDERPGLTARQLELLRDEALYLDLLQLSIWRSLSFRYVAHWNLESYHEISGFSGTISSGVVASDSTEQWLEYSDFEIKKIFRDNLLLQTWTTQADNPSFFLALLSPKLPLGTKVTSARENGKRTLAFVNSGITFRITISSAGEQGGPLPHSGLGQKIRDTYHIDEVALRGYLISTEWSVKPLLRWSPNTVNQIRWVKDVEAHIAAEYDWKTIREKLDK